MLQLIGRATESDPCRRRRRRRRRRKKSTRTQRLDEMRGDQLIPVDRRLEHFLLEPDLVVALELVRQLDRVAQCARQPIIHGLVFRILPIECGSR